MVNIANYAALLIRQWRASSAIKYSVCLATICTIDIQKGKRIPGEYVKGFLNEFLIFIFPLISECGP